MAGREVLRQWFIPGDGIDRHVISTDIQRYLGNDATVRPGVGNGDNEVRRPTPVLVSEEPRLHHTGRTRLLDQGLSESDRRMHLFAHVSGEC